MSSTDALDRNLDAFQGSEDIFGHHLHIDGSRVVAIDGEEIPTGAFTDVEGTVFDYRTPERIGYRLNSTDVVCGEGECFSFLTLQQNKQSTSTSQDVSDMTIAGSTTIRRQQNQASLYGAMCLVSGEGDLSS